MPAPCLSVAAHQLPAFGFITSQQVRQMAVINYQEALLWCHLSLTQALCNVLYNALSEGYTLWEQRT